MKNKYIEKKMRISKNKNMMFLPQNCAVGWADQMSVRDQRTRGADEIS